LSAQKFLLRFRGGKWDGQEIEHDVLPEEYVVPLPVPLERMLGRSEVEMPNVEMRALIYRRSELITNEQLERGPLGPTGGIYDFAGYKR
jgi:hypothetical protein